MKAFEKHTLLQNRFKFYQKQKEDSVKKIKTTKDS